MLKQSSPDWDEMLVRIRTSPTGPLQVIDGLPDAKLAMLEGLNGIGKTLAVRLLQLCAGTMPYDPTSPAWDSLREGLGDLEVELTNLKGGNSITWITNSTDWDLGHRAIPDDSWFRSITVNGLPATLADVRQLVSVTRLAGDEDLTETFASEAESHALALQRWAASHTGPDEGPLATLEQSVGIASDLLATTSVEMLKQLRLEANSAREDLARKRDSVLELQSHRQHTIEATELLRQLRALREQEPALTKSLNDVDNQIVLAQHAQAQAQQDVTRLAAQVGRTEPFERELENAERTLQRNKKKLATLSWRVAGQAAALGVEPGISKVRAFIDRLEQKRSELIARQREFDKTPEMISLLGSLQTDLESGESRGLGDQIAVDDSELGVQLTVAQTRAAMQERQRQLQDDPPHPLAHEASRELQRITGKLTNAKSLLEIVDDMARFERLVSTNEERVDKALAAGAGGEAVKALHSASNRRREYDQALLDLAARRAALAQRLGDAGDETSKEALAGKLSALLQRLNTSEVDLEEETIRAERLAADAESDLAVAAEAVREWNHRVTLAEANIRSSVDVLNRDPRLGWLRDALNWQEPTSAGDIDRLHRQLEYALSITRSILARLGDHRHQLGAIEIALHGSARQLRGEAVGTSKYVDEVQAWLASRFSAWFNNTRVRRELLPDSDEGSVTVDIAARKVSWIEAGAKRSRPLVAFSSGEQAFAYTRARLALLDHDDSAVSNRLIVLDEFGAFIAHHLLQGLLAYLKDRAAARGGDQVLLILPVSNNYAQMAKSTIGNDAGRYRILADQIQNRQYAVRTIVP